MATQVCSNAQIEQIRYMALPNSNRADVRLHKNICEITDEDGATYYQADEVYFRAAITYEEVVANFDELYENGGPLPTVADAETEEDKYAALEAQVAALSDSIKTVKSNLTLVAEAVSTGDELTVSDDGTISVDKSTIKDAEPIEGSL